MSEQKKLNSLQDLGNLQKEIRHNTMNKQEYQDYWKSNKYKFRKMIAKKNKVWLTENKQNTQFKYYEKIDDMFSVDKSRKFLIHVITNFFPLDNCVQVPKLPKEKNYCDISDLQLTDLDSIIVGKNNARDKHIAYTGKSTSIVLSGIAVQELERFINKYVDDFDSPYGHIINHAFDKLRNN